MDDGHDEAGGAVHQENRAGRDVYAAGRDQVIIQVSSTPPQAAPGIHTHAEEVAGLSGLRRNLTNEFLPFVPPEAADPAHPDQLFSQLSTMSGDGGILLVSVAGVGKTRTCFEVADRALAAGWSVFHVTPGEPLVSTEQLEEAIDVAGGHTLVIIDYLNECQGLDLVALRQRVLPNARSQGKRVALLASARPGWQIQAAVELSSLFKIVRLDNSLAHSARIRDKIIESLAPTAISVLGIGRLRELCGFRPIIGMLIALEAEAQAREGRLDTALPGIKPEELIGWLDRRLKEDHLLAEPSHDLFSDDQPSSTLQSITAMLAGTPQEKSNLIACGSTILDGDFERAEHFLEILRTMGWIVTLPNGLAVVHDIVADHFLEYSLLRPGSWTVRTDVADRIMAGCLGRARSIGRYATNLSRVIRDLDVDGHGEALRAYCANWLASRADRAGWILGERSDEGAFALGAVIESPCWSSVAFTSWQSIVAPWLLQYSQTIFARHVLYKGLRGVHTAMADDLIRESLQWLAVHGDAGEASFVLGPLLGRGELSGDDLTAVTGYALSWLAGHGARPDAGFVFHPLLGRGELAGDDLTTVTGYALSWLAGHGATPDADFVLGPLLGRGELAGDESAAVVGYALSWLASHHARSDAVFVLGPLLARGELSGGESAAVVGYALSWLASHAGRTDARFVLGPLVGRGELAAGVAGYALSWLASHGATPGARFVLYPMLGLGELSGDAAAAAIQYALGWLASHGVTPDADFILHPLLERDELSGDTAAAAIQYALSWLASHPARPDADYVLRPLLERDELSGDSAAAAIGHALTWLSNHDAIPNACFVLHSLLERVDPAYRDVAVTHALTWLTTYGATPDAGFVFPPLIARLTTQELDSDFVRMVGHWIESNPADPGIGYVAKYLSRRGIMTKQIAAGVIRSAKEIAYSEDIAWLVTPVTRSLVKFPELAEELIAALELHVYALPPQDTKINMHSQFDGMLEQLARRQPYWLGILAARFDDIIDAWVHRPEAFTDNCSEDSYYTALVSRTLSLVYSGRFDSEYSDALLERLRTWIEHWKCARQEQWRTEAFALVAYAETIKRARYG